jgi:hypothetical protein
MKKRPTVMGKGMRKARAKTAAPVSPINFRIPKPLRTRVRKYADARHIGEAQALRVLVSEHLDEVESAAELAVAERWQYEQAYATWDAFLRGDNRAIPREEIQRIFARGLEPMSETTTRTA